LLIASEVVFRTWVHKDAAHFISLEDNIASEVVGISLDEREVVVTSGGKGTTVYVLYAVYLTCPTSRGFIDDFTVTTDRDGEHVTVSTHSADIIVLAIEPTDDFFCIVVYFVFLTVSL